VKLVSAMFGKYVVAYKDKTMHHPSDVYIPHNAVQ